MSAGGIASARALLSRLARAEVRRVAVVQTAFLGDTVFSAALVAGLAARFPEAKITLVVTPRGRDVARAMPSCDDVLVYDKRGLERGLAGFFAAARRLRERECALAVLPHRSLRSGLLAHRAGIPERLGFANAPARFLYTAAARDPGGPFLAREAALLETLGASPGPMRLVPAVEDRRAAGERLRRRGEENAAPAPPDGEKVAMPTIGTPINPAAPLVAFALGSEWATKIWPTAHTAALAVRLAARGMVPLLLGGPRENAIAAEIVRACPAALDTTGSSVGEALALLERAILCIGGDTGLVHAARALGIPTLLLFGPTDPALHLLGPRERALSLKLACSPCSAHGGRRCPLGHHRCLRDLSVEQVEEAALALLESARRRAPAGRAGDGV